MSDEFVASTADEDSSLEPEDLGSHFLSEAIVQGSPPTPAASLGDLELFDEADLDAQQPSAEVELEALGRLAALAARGGEASQQLRDAAELAADQLDAERAAFEEPEPRTDVRLIDSIIREASLLDHEGAQPGEIVSPNIATDDTGRHTRHLTSDGCNSARIQRKH